MLLQNGELTLRSALPRDAQTLFNWWNDGAVMAHAGFPRGLGVTVESVAALLETDEEGIRQRLILELSGSPIGEMSYRRTEGNRAQIGIKICDPSQQERGLGRRALSMLIRELFARGFEKIILDTNAKNTRAQHVYSSLGFVELRVNASAWTDQLGEPQTSIDYELTPDGFVSFIG